MLMPEYVHIYVWQLLHGSSATNGSRAQLTVPSLCLCGVTNSGAVTMWWLPGTTDSWILDEMLTAMGVGHAAASIYAQSYFDNDILGFLISCESHDW